MNEADFTEYIDEADRSVAAMKRRAEDAERAILGAVAIMLVLVQRAGGEIVVTGADLDQVDRRSKLIRLPDGTGGITLRVKEFIA